MEGIRTRLGDDVHLAGGAAELRRIDAGLHFEFFERVDRRQEDVGVEIDVGVVDAVERVVVELAPLAGDRDLLAGARAALAITGLAGPREPGADVRAQSNETEIVATVQRQLDNPPILDDGADCRIRGGDERRGGGDFSRFGERAEFEREVDAKRLLDVQFHGVLHGLEPFQLDLDLVRARRHRGKRVDASLVALLGADRVGCHILRGHGGARNCAARLIFHFTGDGAKGLGVTGGAEQEANDNTENTSRHARLLMESKRAATRWTPRQAANRLAADDELSRAHCRPPSSRGQGIHRV